MPPSIQERKAFLKQFDIIVQPSQQTRYWAENDLASILQGLALGKKVIGTQSGLIPWLFKELELDDPIPPNDPYQLSIAMMKAIEEHHSPSKDKIEQLTERFSNTQAAKKLGEIH